MWCEAGTPPDVSVRVPGKKSKRRFFLNELIRRRCPTQRTPKLSRVDKEVDREQYTRILQHYAEFLETYCPDILSGNPCDPV
jgi:hypothetical protein